MTPAQKIILIHEIELLCDLTYEITTFPGYSEDWLEALTKRDKQFDRVKELVAKCE